MKKKGLGPLEHKVMDIVWAQKEATVYSVVETIEKEKSLAYTTVMTVMSRLTKKGLLSRKKNGKTYVYRPRQTKETFVHSLVKNTISRMVDAFGDEALVAFFDETQHLSEEHKQRLLKKISDDN